MPSVYYQYKPGSFIGTDLLDLRRINRRLVTERLNAHSEEPFEEGRLHSFFYEMNQLDDPPNELIINVVAKKTRKRLEARKTIAEEIGAMLAHNFPCDFTLKLFLIDQVWWTASD